MSYREPILDAALTLFSERGFSSASVAEVARIAGAAESTIFHHFKNKDELFLAVIEHVRESFVGAISGLSDDESAGSGLDLLGASIGLFLLMSETNPREVKLLFLEHSHMLASSNPACSRHLEATYDAFVQAFAEAITLGVQDGSIRPVQPERQAMLILSMLSGVVRFRTFGLWSSNRSYSDARELCLRALAAEGYMKEEP